MEKLRAECEHLRVMLDDANQMRNIEMDILKDEKQLAIDGLNRKSEYTQGQRDELQRLVDELMTLREGELQLQISSSTTSKEEKLDSIGGLKEESEHLHGQQVGYIVALGSE